MSLGDQSFRDRVVECLLWMNSFLALPWSIPIIFALITLYEWLYP